MFLFYYLSKMYKQICDTLYHTLQHNLENNLITHIKFIILTKNRKT